MKQKLDFMTYMEPELNWFSMNFLCIFLPIYIVLDIVVIYARDFKGHESTTLAAFVIASGVIHFIFFCLRHFQFTLEPK